LHLPARPILFGDRSLRARHGNVFVVVDPRRDTRASGLNLVKSGDGRRLAAGVRGTLQLPSVMPCTVESFLP